MITEEMSEAEKQLNQDRRRSAAGLLDMLSPVAISNLFTMGVCAKTDSRQHCPPEYVIPPEGVRLLRAKLIMEETLEKIAGLGFQAVLMAGPEEEHATIRKELIEYLPGPEPDLDDIIDGCCDIIYVATGTLLVCGAPDVPHLSEVCRRNDAKFPGGVAVMNESGKFQKPEGWQPPDHEAVRKRVAARAGL